MRSVKLFAPATSANVGPGYDIFALTLKEPHDEVTITLNDSGQLTFDITGNRQGIPTAIQDNVATLAVLELLKRKNIKQGMHIVLHKNMISGGGLGTTGASASACISGLNELLGLELSSNEMIDIARMGEVASGGSPHADNVAAGILGGFVLVKSYHPIDVLKLEVPEIPIVLAVIRKSQRTTRGFITYEIGQEKLKEQMARCSRVIHAIHTRDIEEFGRAISVDYIAEPVRSAAIPGYQEIKAKVLDAGAYGFNVSGGGSSVFAVCPDSRMDEIAGIMEEGCRNNPLFFGVIMTTASNSGVRIIERYL